MPFHSPWCKNCCSETRPCPASIQALTARTPKTMKQQWTRSVSKRSSLNQKNASGVSLKAKCSLQARAFQSLVSSCLAPWRKVLERCGLGGGSESLGSGFERLKAYPISNSSSLLHVSNWIYDLPASILLWLPAAMPHTTYELSLRNHKTKKLFRKMLCLGYYITVTEKQLIFILILIC